MSRPERADDSARDRLLLLSKRLASPRVASTALHSLDLVSQRLERLRLSQGRRLARLAIGLELDLARASGLGRRGQSLLPPNYRLRDPRCVARDFLSELARDARVCGLASVGTDRCRLLPARDAGYLRALHWVAHARGLSPAKRSAAGVEIPEWIEQLDVPAARALGPIVGLFVDTYRFGLVPRSVETISNALRAESVVCTREWARHVARSGAGWLIRAQLPG